jgi:ammonia channel protein AmtB
VIGPVAAGFVEKMGIDDAVGAVAVHGVCGILGLLFAGLFLGGYPTFSEDIPAVTFFGQFKGMIVMVLLGFIPGYVLAFAFKKIGILRAGDNVQEVGMDVEIAALAYPEEIISDAAK